MTRKRVGFYICTVGKGHEQQARVVFDILRRNEFEIPYVASVGQRVPTNYGTLFPGSVHEHKSCAVGVDDIAKLTLVSRIKIMSNILFKPFQSQEIVDRYGIDLMLSFWTPSRRENPSVPALCLADQFTVKRFDVLAVVLAMKQTPVAVGAPSPFAKHWIPPLIDVRPLKRRRPQRGTYVAYHATGTAFLTCLRSIARSNPRARIHLFTICANPSMPSNVKVHRPVSHEIFRDTYLSRASAVLTTAGKTLVQECNVHKIPVAVLACSRSHFEQVENEIDFVKRKKCAIRMTPKMNLHALATSKLGFVSIDAVERDRRVLRLVRDVLKKTEETKK